MHQQFPVSSLPLTSENIQFRETVCACVRACVRMLHSEDQKHFTCKVRTFWVGYVCECCQKRTNVCLCKSTHLKIVSKNEHTLESLN